MIKLKRNSKYQFDNNQLIYIHAKDNKQKLFSNDEIEKIIIPSSVIKELISTFPIHDRKFIDLINQFDEIYTDIEYPSSEYHEIIDFIIQMKKSNEIRLNLEIIIYKIDGKEKQFYHNKYVDSIIIKCPI